MSDTIKFEQVSASVAADEIFALIMTDIAPSDAESEPIGFKSCVEFSEVSYQDNEKNQDGLLIQIEIAPEKKGHFQFVLHNLLKKIPGQIGVLTSEDGPVIHIMGEYNNCLVAIYIYLEPMDFENEKEKRPRQAGNRLR